MKKVLKYVLYVLLVLAFLAAVLFGFRWYTSKRTAEAPITVNSDVYLTTAVGNGANANAAPAEEDNLASDSSIEETTWPFAESKSEAEDGFVAKKSTGYTRKTASAKTTAAAKTTKKSSDKTSEETTKKSSDSKTTKKSSSNSGSAKAFLQKIQSSASKTNNGHPVKVDSNGISIEYQKFAVADLNGDGKDEVFLYAVSNKGDSFYGNSYIVYDSSLSSARTTMVVDEYDKGPTFYKSGAYEIATNKFGFTSDSLASSFGVKNANSILGFDTNATPYLEYMTNGPYIDAPSEISASDYNAKVKKLKAGGKVSVKVYDFTSANVDKLS